MKHLMSDFDGFRDSRQWVTTGRSQGVGHRKLTYTTALRKKNWKNANPVKAHICVLCACVWTYECI